MENGKTSVVQPAPVLFSSLNLPGFTAPTSFQAEIIPLIMDGKDVIGVAEPGSAKSAAYVIPILLRLAKGNPGNTRALVLSPRIETAENICEMAIRLGKSTGLKSAVVYSKSTGRQQTVNVDIITGTPGSVLESLWKGALDLSSLEIIVIDEIDQMPRHGLLPDIFNILMCIAHKRQTLVFTAGISENIQRLTRQFLHDPVTVIAMSGVINKTAAPKNDKTFASTHTPVTPSKFKANTDVLRKMLGTQKNDAVLVFTRTKENARRAARIITEAGYYVGLVGGKLPPTGQGIASKKLPAGPVIILLVTDNASIGLDTARIFKVINDTGEKPGNGKVDYSRRSGKVDENGKAFTLVTTADEITLHALEKCLDEPLEKLTV